MARLSVSDYLQVFPFHLLDVAPASGAAYPVFFPGSSFSSVSSPEITLDMTDINEGNSLFPKKVIKKGEIASVVLQRGASLIDSDFYRWIMVALKGNPFAFSGRRPIQLGGPTPRRDLLLIHFLRHSPLPRIATVAAATATLGGFIAASGGGGEGTIAGLVTGAAGGALTALRDVVPELGALPLNQAVRMPARAWVLKGCLPKRYKAGTDFEASSGEVSIMELEVEVERFEEYSLGNAPIALGSR